jgi:colanic acid/amylovoran biosynthesis protein
MTYNLTRPKTKVAILGTPTSSGNRGVLALGASLVALCLKSGSRVSVTVIDGKRDGSPFPTRHDSRYMLIPVVNFRLSLKSIFTEHLLWIAIMALLFRSLPVRFVRQKILDSTPTLKAIAEADVVGDIRGGDSFSDIYGLKRFLISFLPSWTVILVKGSIVHFPQTYGPFKTRTGRLLARFLLLRSSVVIARDKASQNVAQKLVQDKIPVYLSPDVAFSLEPVVPERIILDPPVCESKPSKTIIGLNVNGLMYYGGYTRDNMFGLKLDYPILLQDLVKSLLVESDTEIWLVPHTWAEPGNVESDNGASAELRDRFSAAEKSRVRMVASEYDQHEIKGVIGQCDFFVGSRMHSCIAALSQGIPCVGIAYSMKFHGVFESVGVGDHIVDARRSDNHNALVTTLDLFARREEIRDPLREASDKARQDLNRIFSELLSVSDRTRLKRVGD